MTLVSDGRSAYTFPHDRIRPLPSDRFFRSQYAGYSGSRIELASSFCERGDAERSMAAAPARWDRPIL